VDSILRCFLTLEEVKVVLNNFHSVACGGHLSGLETAQKNLFARYFCPTIFKDCIEVVERCHPCKIFTKKMHSHPAPMFPFIIVGHFIKWGVDFMTCHPTSARRQCYVIVSIKYFTKWVQAMPTFSNDGETTTLFIFNHVIARFWVPREIVTDHGSHF
jgi:hypothetical protein